MLRAQQFLFKKLGHSRDLFQDIINKPELYTVDKLKQIDPEVVTNKLIYIACHHDRRSYGEKVKAISRNMLEVLRDNHPPKLDVDQILSLLISKSHILLKDESFIQKLLNQLKEVQDKIDFKQCLHINHVFYKLKINEPELEKFALQKIMENRDQLYHYEQISYLSMESNKMLKTNSDEKFQTMLDNFVTKTLPQKRYLISQKCSFQFCQMLFNLFPELVSQDYFDFDIDRSRKYAQYFDAFRHEYILSRLLLSKRQRYASIDFQICDKQSNSFKTRVEKVKAQSKFEENVQELVKLLGVNYQTNKVFAIYETDINIGDDFIIQLNGQYHFIEDLFGNIISYQPNHEMCIRHLQALKLKKIISIDYNWWQNIDPRQKQIDFLKKELGLI
ncbi:hypothetical protein pb186bvf_010741 [Paramecium bursaria]